MQQEERAKSGEAGGESLLGRMCSFVPGPNWGFTTLLVTQCYIPKQEPKAQPALSPPLVCFVRRGTSPSNRRWHLPWELQHREEGKTKMQRLLSWAAWTIPVIHWRQDFSGESAKMAWSWFVVQRRKSPFLPSFRLTSLCYLSALVLCTVHPPLQAALHVVLINPCWVPLWVWLGGATTKCELVSCNRSCPR